MMKSQKTKEEFSMKYNRQSIPVGHYTSQPTYPNAADTNYFTAKALEILAAVVSGLGCMVGMIFLVIMA